MFLRIALLFIACGALALSRVLVVQNEHPIPRFASLAWFGASDSSSASSHPGYGKALTASGGASSHIKIKAGSSGSKNLAPLSRLSTLRHRLASQVQGLGSYTEGMGEVRKKIGARIPRAWLRRRQQKDGPRWKGLDFAAQLARRLSLGKGVVVGVKREQGMDDRVLELVKTLEEEGRQALGEDDWRLVSSSEEIKVWRRSVPEGTYGGEYPCVKVSKVVNAPAEQVMELILDSDRVHEYNRYSQGRTDVQHLGPNTKIVRNRTQPPLSKKPHEFCTLMHVLRRDDGSRVMLTKFTDHPRVPRTSDYVRSEIILGVTEVKPHPQHADKVVFTTVSHVKSAGVPAFMADRFSVRGVVDFIGNMEAALLTSRSKGNTNSQPPGQR